MKPGTNIFFREMQRKRARAVKKATSRGRKKYDDRGGGRALEIVHLWVGGCKEMAQAEGLGNSTRESDHAGACLAVEMVHLQRGSGTQLERVAMPGPVFPGRGKLSLMRGRRAKGGRGAGGTIQRSWFDRCSGSAASPPKGGNGSAVKMKESGGLV